MLEFIKYENNKDKFTEEVWYEYNKKPMKVFIKHYPYKPIRLENILNRIESEHNSKFVNHK